MPPLLPKRGRLWSSAHLKRFETSSTEWEYQTTQMGVQVVVGHTNLQEIKLQVLSGSSNVDREVLPSRQLKGQRGQDRTIRKEDLESGSERKI